MLHLMSSEWCRHCTLKPPESEVFFFVDTYRWSSLCLQAIADGTEHIKTWRSSWWCAGWFFWLRNSVSIKPLTFEHLQSIKTDLHVGFTEVLGAWNFTLQADTPLYWLRCGRLDKCPRGTLTPRVLDMTWDTQKCNFLRLMDKLLQTLRCEYLMILQGLNTGFCPWKHRTAWTFAWIDDVQVPLEVYHALSVPVYQRHRSARRGWSQGRVDLKHFFKEKCSECTLVLIAAERKDSTWASQADFGGTDGASFWVERRTAFLGAIF